MNLSGYAMDSPYPKLRIERPNLQYAKMILSNVGGKTSEMGAVSLYFYNHLVTHDNSEIANIFHSISIVEMHHLEIFGELALMLGTDPRLWAQRDGKMVYWNGSYNNYPRTLVSLIKNSLSSELQAIAKYRKQERIISDKYIKEVLQKIIEDEEVHVKIFKDLLKKPS